MKATNKNEPVNKYDVNLVSGLRLAGKNLFVINILAFIALKTTSSESIQGGKIWHTFAPVFAGIAGICFVSLILYNGIRSLGLHAVKDTLGSQVWLVAKRLTLFLFLPCILVTATIIIIAYIVSR